MVIIKIKGARIAVIEIEDNYSYLSVKLIVFIYITYELKNGYF